MRARIDVVLVKCQAVPALRRLYGRKHKGCREVGEIGHARRSHGKFDSFFCHKVIFY